MRRFTAVTGAPGATPPLVAASGAEDATTSFVYNRLGRVVTATDALGYFTGYGYDALGNRVSVIAKSSSEAIAAGAATTYMFDRRELMTSETILAAIYADSATSAARRSSTGSNMTRTAIARAWARRITSRTGVLIRIRATCVRPNIVVTISTDA